MYRLLIVFFLLSFNGIKKSDPPSSWIRINQLGYTPNGTKVAVWCSKSTTGADKWHLVEAHSKKKVYSASAGKSFGAYGPFLQTFRLNFTAYTKPGRYYLQLGATRSPEFMIGNDVYKGAADFCLRYMRQQRSGFNPFLKDSCHTRDGYVLYGEKAGIRDSTYIDVVGGWHDASDYLQYSTTSANATYHLLMAYRDFPKMFTDAKLANGLDGKNGRADILDEAKWGLDWLLKMHPGEDQMFNQIADDRDHIGMRIPKEDTQYGKENQRPVYYVSGEPQQRGKYMNNTTGTSSTAGKFASSFALGSLLFKDLDKKYSQTLVEKSFSAALYGKKRVGVTQTASVKSPYIYAEDNWTDDMELAEASLTRISSKENNHLSESYSYARQEPVTPWLGKDTASHYQWYPFINLGHYELAKHLKDKRRDTIVGFYKEGIQRVWSKAKQNAFYRGIPFIWCSNNLTTSFAIQCYWYKELSGDKTYDELEQANFDWLFGCNPWGTSMVYGLPDHGDTPVDPHSAFTHLKNYPIDGGLVDGPVYGSIYNNLIGISLYDPDEYADFQSNLAVYHDDYGDYSTNEPTMDGTASLIYLLAAKEAESYSKNSGAAGVQKNFSYDNGALIRGDSSQKKIALVFTGDEFADGGNFIAETLRKEKLKASFFFTGRFYRNKNFQRLIDQLNRDGHFLGAHSDNHLLYCDWIKRDSILVSKKQFTDDLLNNYAELNKLGINKEKAGYFLPPYEWYNDSISMWTNQLGLELINFTPGTNSTADYTYPELKNYWSSESIYKSIIERAQNSKSGLNGFILLLHIGTDPRRTDKFYKYLPRMIKHLHAKGYQFQTVNQLLNR